MTTRCVDYAVRLLRKLDEAGCSEAAMSRPQIAVRDRNAQEEDSLAITC